MLYHIFDLACISAGLILAADRLRKIESVGDNLDKLSKWLLTFKSTIGATALAIGTFFLIFRSGCAIHDTIGMMVGMILLANELNKIPAVGDSLVSISKSITPFQIPIGIAGIVVGFLGLLDIHILC